MNLINTKLYQLKDLAEIVALLQQDELIAFPTETVFGLGGNAYSDVACRKIYQAKGRPQDNPFIVHMASLDRLPSVATQVPPIAYELFKHFTPGPLTIILPKTEAVSPVATAGLSSVAVRIPSHPVAQALLQACPVPIAAPSANRSHRPSPTTSAMVLQEMQGRIAGVLHADQTEYGLESTVISCLHEEILLMRPGSVPLEDIKSFLQKYGYSIRHAQTATDAVSPGTRHAHYQPVYPIKLFTSENLPPISAPAQEKIGLCILQKTVEQTSYTPPKHWVVSTFANEQDYARQLFYTLVRMEQQGVSLLYAQWPSATGIGLALRDRLQRAASPARD